MKAVQFLAPGRLALAELPDPEPLPGWVRVRTTVAALCMTDFELLDGSFDVRFPLVAGHEWSGIVDRAGSADDERWIGCRVTGDNEICCLKCHYCRSGQWRRCPEYKQIGFEAPGAYAEHLLVPSHNLHVLPDNVSFEQGALVEPLGVGLAVAAMAGAAPGATAAVLGAGPIGLNCLAALKASGVRRILCLDRSMQRCARASSWGAYGVYQDIASLRAAASKFHPRGTDIIVEAAGSLELLEAAVEVAPFGGAVILAGYLRDRQMALTPDHIQGRNLRVLGAGNNVRFNLRALESVGDGVISTESMITHRFTLDDFSEAFSRESVERPDYLKGIFEF
jgi:threonine dehydrogenase-like Zn-dependent dehydrogenase